MAADAAQMDAISLITLVPAGPTTIRPDDKDVPTTTFLDKQTRRPVLGLRVRLARHGLVNLAARPEAVTFVARISLAWLDVEALLDTTDVRANPAYWNIRLQWVPRATLASDWGRVLEAHMVFRGTFSRNAYNRTLGQLAMRLLTLASPDWPAEWTSDWVLVQLRSFFLGKPDQPRVFKRDYQD
jgi:hypothetical protein